MDQASFLEVLRNGLAANQNKYCCTLPVVYVRKGRTNQLDCRLTKIISLPLILLIRGCESKALDRSIAITPIFFLLSRDARQSCIGTFYKCKAT